MQHTSGNCNYVPLRVSSAKCVVSQVSFICHRFHFLTDVKVTSPGAVAVAFHCQSQLLEEMLDPSNKAHHAPDEQQRIYDVMLMSAELLHYRIQEIPSYATDDRIFCAVIFYRYGWYADKFVQANFTEEAKRIWSDITSGHILPIPP